MDHKTDYINLNIPYTQVNRKYNPDIRIKVQIYLVVFATITIILDSSLFFSQVIMACRNQRYAIDQVWKMMVDT